MYKYNMSEWCKYNINNDHLILFIMYIYLFLMLVQLYKCTTVVNNGEEYTTIELFGTYIKYHEQN